jgi:hypothetical protein
MAELEQGEGRTVVSAVIVPPRQVGVQYCSDWVFVRRGLAVSDQPCSGLADSSSLRLTQVVWRRPEESPRRC